MKRFIIVTIALLLGCMCIGVVLSLKGGEMGFFQKLFARRGSVSEKTTPCQINFAFVLLTEARLPSAASIVHAFRDYAVPGEALLEDADDSRNSGDSEAVTLTLKTGEKLFVVLVPTAVPKGEADDHVQFSLSRFKDDWTLPEHHAHLMVTFASNEDKPSVAGLSRFASVLAAVIRASSAVGIYWGNAGATHSAEFFLSVASEQSVSARTMLWSGFSVAREEDGRLSLLSLGMEQLNLPDLLLVAGKESERIAIPMMYDLLSFVGQNGEPLPEGDTVGRDSEERLVVHYVKSPVDSEKNVWRVELP